MKNLKYILMFAFSIALFASCNSSSSDDDDEDDDTDVFDMTDPTSAYYNWPSRNITYFNEKYNEAKKNADGKWYVIKGYSKKGTSVNDSILVHVLNQNVDAGHSEVINGMPNTSGNLITSLYNEYPEITYRGNLMPFDSNTTYAFYNSTNGPDELLVGSCFDTKFYETQMDTTTAVFTRMSPSSCIIGMASALMYMHKGDRWRIFIPYNLGYGTSSTSSIPAYSVLIFDVFCKNIYQDDND